MSARLVAAAALLASVPVACHALYDGEIAVFRCEQQGAYGPPACPPSMTCVNGLCSAIGAPLGQSCAADGDCRDDSFCLDPASMGFSGPPRCSRLCCAANDCDRAEDGQVCFAPPNATGAVCWSASDLGRAPVGGGRQGASCMTGGDCRSGVCESGRCADMCCSDSYCAPDLVCRKKLLSSLSERPIFACGEEAGPTLSGECDSDDDCITGICADAGEGVRVCAAPCCSSRDCADVLLVVGVVRKLACAPVDGALRACSQLLPGGADAVLGAACVDGNDCRSGLCIEAPSGRICSDTCCEDASCGDAAAFACRPAELGDTWALRCVPR